jgi:hypothetical protein
MHRWFTIIAPLLLILLPALASAQDMDFGSGEEGGGEVAEAPPPEAEPEAPVQPEPEAEPAPAAEPAPEPEPAEAGDTRTPAFAFAITAEQDLRELTMEIDRSLRDLLAASPHVSSALADGVLNGRSVEASEALQGARDLFDSGRAAYDGLDLVQASTLFGQALEAYEEQIAHLGDLNEISDCLLYLGAAEVLQGRTRQSRAFFVRLLIVDPERRPDPDVFPPPVTEAFDYVASQLPHVPSGGITVASTPEQADVFVDGVFQGTTPATVTDMKAGRHYVRIRRQGFVEAGQVIEVTARRSTAVEASLSTAEGGQVIDELLGQLATQVVAGSDEAVATVQRLGEELGLEVLFTATVVRADSGVTVRLDGWNAVTGAAISSRNAGPFEADPVSIAGDVQPGASELLDATWSALSTAQAPIEPVVEPVIEPQPLPPRRPFWRQWWFWTAVGAVVVGAGLGIGLGVGLSDNGNEGPQNGEVILDL